MYFLKKTDNLTLEKKSISDQWNVLRKEAVVGFVQKQFLPFAEEYIKKKLRTNAQKVTIRALKS